MAGRYTAAKQLSKFDEALGGTAQGRDYLAAAAEVEGSVNEAELDISKGTTAVFGGIYQVSAHKNCASCQAWQSMTRSMLSALQLRLRKDHEALEDDG